LRNTIDEAIEIITAFRDGKDIQVLNPSGTVWFTCANPTFNFQECMYRVTPPEIRLFGRIEQAEHDAHTTTIKVPFGPENRNPKSNLELVFADGRLIEACVIQEK
jgi:hypothetical protein